MDAASYLRFLNICVFNTCMMMYSGFITPLEAVFRIREKALEGLAVT